MNGYNANLPPHPEEIAERNREIERALLERERRMRARSNRLAGHPEPRVGDVLHVSTARGIKSRTRAGCRFNDSARTAITVVDATDEEILAKRQPGTNPSEVNVNGAEEILADDALIVHRVPNADAVAELDAKLAAANAESDAKDRRIKDLEAELAKARRNAPPSQEGEPSRLRAAAAAAADFGETTKLETPADVSGGAPAAAPAPKAPKAK